MMKANAARQEQQQPLRLFEPLLFGWQRANPCLGLGGQPGTLFQAHLQMRGRSIRRSLPSAPAWQEVEAWQQIRVAQRRDDLGGAWCHMLRRQLVLFVWPCVPYVPCGPCFACFPCVVYFV